MSDARSEELAGAIGCFLEELQRSADHAGTNPLRELSKDEKVTLRRAVKDLLLYRSPLVKLLKNTPGALDMLGPVLSAATVIGWFTGPQEAARPFIEQRRAAIARAAPGKPGGRREKATATRRERAPILEVAIQQALQSGEKRTHLAHAVNAILESKGHASVSETTIKRVRQRMGLVRGKAGHS